MISTILNQLEAGFRRLKSNSRMLLVCLLIIVFPLIFVWVSQGFYQAASINLDSAEKQHVSVLHNSLATLVVEINDDQDAVIAKYLHRVGESNKSLASTHIFSLHNNQLETLFKTNDLLNGSFESTKVNVRTLPISTSSPLIIPLSLDNSRSWQVYSKAQSGENVYYIVTEHDFTKFDSLLISRWQTAYYGLSAIFLFMIILAYWVHKQVDWKIKHEVLAHKLDEQMMFINMIAHEFRAPLTASKGYISFLEESKDIGSTEMKYVTTIKTANERLVALVNDFLDVARMQSGKIEVNKMLIDVREVLIGVTQNLSPEASEKGLELTYMPGKKKIFVNTDKNRLTQVLLNLINNSIKYTEKGSIKIECKETRAHLQIVIMDTGTGISAKDQKRLFTPFERFDNAEKGKQRGTGLGMYITKQLVELLDGTIEVESIKEVGSHITISLPIV